jgi:DtxR family Mn-dependent transcriptional regulator
LEDHKDHALDELLEALYKVQEEGRPSADILKLRLAAAPSKSEMESFEQRDLISLQNDKITLTTAGMIQAEALVRRHRLAERLFSEILELNESSLDMTSCSFEHVLDPTVTEQICTMLGHPPTCPHGKRIPPGDCCKNSRNQIGPLVVPLKDLMVGATAKIVFITTPFHQRLNRLINLGVVPGGKIFLAQKKPSFLLRLGQTEIAIDQEIASEIYVRKL